MPNPHTFTTSNPVVVGYDTEKPHYDAVFENAAYIKWAMDNGYPFVLQGWYEVLQTLAIVAGVLTIDLSLGNVCKVSSLNANITSIVFSNIPSSGKAVRFELITVGDGTPRSIAWPASVKWPSAVAPTPTSTNGNRDRYVFSTEDGGTTWDGLLAGQNIG